MLTTRLEISSEEDPFDGAPRADSSSRDNKTVFYCNDELVLNEWRCQKQSQWLKEWRCRWMVLTTERLYFFRSHRGYAMGHRETESFGLLRMGRAHLITASQENMTMCEPPSHDVVLIYARERPVLLAFEDADGSSAADGIVTSFITALVNARCAVRFGRAEYLQPGCMHAFEQIGAAVCGERYMQGTELGRGSFGVVREGRCLQSGRKVAIKEVSLIKHKQSVHMEVSILREVQHPHVVSLLNYLETGVSRGFMVMELLPGGDLYSQVVSWEVVLVTAVEPATRKTHLCNAK